MFDVKDVIIDRLNGILETLDACGALTDEDRLAWNDALELSFNANENYYTVHFDGDDDGEGKIYHFDDRADKMFYDVSKTIAFSDCSGEKVSDIVWCGRPVEYAGWAPGMRFTFIDKETKEVIWEEVHEEWDH